MYILKWFRFIIAKIYNILRYVIPRILRHMCNLHIKETEISQKRSKGIKNWKITYSVILSTCILSNKTKLILGFSSPLKHPEILCAIFADLLQRRQDTLGTRLTTRGILGEFHSNFVSISNVCFGKISQFPEPLISSAFKCRKIENLKFETQKYVHKFFFFKYLIRKKVRWPRFFIRTFL